MKAERSFVRVFLGFGIIPLCCHLGPAQNGSWTNLQPATSPPSRIGHGLAPVPGTELIVAYGGTSAGTTGLDDTWVFDGCNWTLVPTTGSPGGRWNFGMAPSPIPGRIVLFGGGIAPYVVVGGTFEFDIGSASWTDMTPLGGPSPSPRQLASMVYDSVRGRTVLFGGVDGGGGSFYNDTWEWNGIAWTDMTTVSGSIPPRAWHAMAFDAARGRTVVYGGYNGSQLGDTWEWNGAQWTQVTTANSPGGRSSAAMAYDSSTLRSVLFGGSVGWPVGMNDTWEYDGTNWFPVGIVSPSPVPQYQHLMASDSARGGALVFGAYGNNQVLLNETWRYQRASLTATTLTPAIGTTVGFTISLPGDAGFPYLAGVCLSGTCPGLPIPGGRFVPLNQDAVLALSLSGLFPQVFQTFTGTLNGAGLATPALAIPSLPILVGAAVSAAAVTASGPGIVSITNGVTLSIQ